jgi:hypothetical protein
MATAPLVCGKPEFDRIPKLLESAAAAASAGTGENSVRPTTT